MKLKNQNPKGPKEWNKEDIKAQNLEMAIELGQLVKKFHACKKTALLVVLQGSDASGKDGTIREVFKFVNAIAIGVTVNKVPNFTNWNAVVIAEILV